jgi:hypothetical protein
VSRLALRPGALLWVAVAVSGALLIGLDTQLGFMNDDWWFLIYRRGWSPDFFLRPHLDHIAIAPVAIYKLLVSAFGMSSALPFHAAATLVFLLASVLLFSWLRQRVGAWLALFGAVLILFFGPAWVDLLWAFQIGYFGSVAAGLGALLALDRGDRRGDRLACLLLLVSTSFSELGVPFAVGALVAVLAGRRAWRARLYVPLVPLALYAAWWLGWGHTANSSFSLHNVAVAPQYVINAMAAPLSALLGLATGDNALSALSLDWGRPLLLAAVVLAGWRLWRLKKVPRPLLVAASIGLTFWVLAAFNATIGRAPDNGRYLYPSAVFVLLIAAELLRGIRVSRNGLLATAAVAALALASNLSFLHQGFVGWRDVNDQARADLGAVEIARPAAAPAFALNLDTGSPWLLPVRLPAYYSAVDAYGSPAYSESELAARPEVQRLEADRALAGALGLALAPRKLPPGAPAGRPPSGVRCRELRASAGGRAVRVSPGSLTLIDRGSSGVEIELGRFSDDLPVDLGTLQPGPGGVVEIPRDLSTRRWRLGLKGQGQPVSVCG